MKRASYFSNTKTVSEVSLLLSKRFKNNYGKNKFKTDFLHMLVFFALLIYTNWITISQFTSHELSERERWEIFLQESDVISYEQMKTRNAVTEPWKLTLEKNDIIRNALWKDIEGVQSGFKEGWKYEIAAYRLDKFLGLNMVPPTVEKKFRGKPGSCQLWIVSKMDVRTKVQQNIPVPAEYARSFERAGYLQQAFDNLIGNIDRHMGNVLITEDWRAILIDHSRAFRTEDQYTQQLLFQDLSDDQNFIMKELPRTFVEKLKLLDFDLTKQIVGEYLKEEEIRTLLERKELLMEYIERKIQKFGENAVLY